MKRILKYMKWKLVALWWLLTRKNFYLLSYNSRQGETLESYNVILPEFVFCLQKNHGYKTYAEIIQDLKEIASLCDDILARRMIIDLIETLKKYSIYNYEMVEV